MISTSQREHLTYTLIGQTITIIALVMITWRYIIPGISEIDKNVSDAERIINSYNDTKNKGLDYARLSAVLIEMGNKDELLKIIQATPDETKQSLTKEGNGDYLNWLKNAINASDEDRKKLIQSKKKINSILPTMSPISANIDEENITLKQYIKFIEGRLLKSFNLDNNMALGIQSLQYGNGSNGIPTSIGMFDLRLDFKSPNADIKRFIDFVNDSGNTEILTQSGLLSEDQIPDIMSNPLITMEAFSLQNPLNLANASEINNGRATIRFYLRGASKDDITYLRDSLIERKSNLTKKIETAISDCKKNEVLCSQTAKLEVFQKKYSEFIQGVRANVNGATGEGYSIDDIYTLSQQVLSLRNFEAEFESFNTKLNQ